LPHRLCEPTAASQDLRGACNRRKAVR
jgi:hypothetical protein